MAVSFGMYGYTLYNEKIEEQPIADKISDIKNGYYFVPIEDVPEDYSFHSLYPQR